MGEFVEALRGQLEYAAAADATAMNVSEYTFGRYFPCVYHNLMHPGRRRSGVDIVSGGCRYNWTGTVGVGLANLGDSLAAIDYLIFRAKRVKCDELISALGVNWKGYEEVRRPRSSTSRRWGTSGT